MNKRVKLTDKGKDSLRIGYLNPFDYETEEELQEWFIYLDSVMEVDMEAGETDGAFKVNIGSTDQFSGFI